MQLQVSSEAVGKATVVHAAGELDLHTAPMLQAEVDEVLGGRPPLIVVDLSGVTFMDSTGLSVIVSTVAAMRGHEGQVRVVTAKKKVAKVFKLTGVDQQVGMFASVQEALA